jgi:hypothetical protein
MNLILILFTIMFFNNDSIVVVSAILVLGVFTYTFYNNIFTTVHNTSNTIVYKEVGVQTESLVNTSPCIDSISELPKSTYPCIQPNVLPDSIHVDAEVQTNSFLWDLFKSWFHKTFSINVSDIVRSPTDVKVENWMNKLDTSQSMSASDVISGSSGSNIQNLVEVSDLIYDNSESDLQELVSLYDIMDYTNYGNAMSHPDALFDHILVNNIHQYFIYINEFILSVNPDLINPFI